MGIKKFAVGLISSAMLLSFVPMTSLADSTGWIKDDIGWRYYTYEDGIVNDTWKQINGKWYYFTFSGYCVTGVENYEIEGKYYSFNSSGECLDTNGKTTLKSGWNKVYYAGRSGPEERWKPMIKYNWVYVGSDGKPITGWNKIGGKWYYFSEYNGAMYISASYDVIQRIEDQYYIFRPDSGEMVTGWYYLGNHWYYAKSNGVVCNMEWLYSGGKWYYFDYSGQMISDTVNFQINGVYYSFDSSGACINPSGVSDLGTGWVQKNRSWYYFDENGKPYSGWYKIDGSWYYFHKSGSINTGFSYIENDSYFFNDKGQMVTGWIKRDDEGTNYWNYAGSNGLIYKSRWLNQGGKWYYFTDWGLMVANVENIKIDGKYYSFDSSGACINPNGVSGKITGWFEICSEYGYGGYERYPRWHNAWTYYDSNGVQYKAKWAKIGGNWYYFNEEGIMVNRFDYYIESEVAVYDFDSNGICLNPNNPRVPNLS